MKNVVAGPWPVFCPASPPGSPTISPRTLEPTDTPTYSPVFDYSTPAPAPYTPDTSSKKPTHGGTKTGKSTKAPSIRTKTDKPHSMSYPMSKVTKAPSRGKTSKESKHGKGSKSGKSKHGKGSKSGKDSKAKGVGSKSSKVFAKNGVMPPVIAAKTEKPDKPHFPSSSWGAGSKADKTQSMSYPESQAIKPHLKLNEFRTYDEPVRR